MELSDTTNYTGLIQDMVFLLTGNSADTLADFTTVDRKRTINKWYQKSTAFILEAMDGWKFHGDWATADTVADQDEYTFPSTILHIDRVEIKYSSGTNDYILARPVDERTEKLAMANADDIHTETNPVYHKPDELSLVFDPTPDEAITDGIKVWYTKEVTELSSDDDEPVIAEPFHRILSMGAALDYAISHNMSEKIIVLRRELYGTESNPETGLVNQLKAFYSRRSREGKSRLVPKFQNYK
jgi:hypothetical protein